jgi:hypothetical protein
MWAWLAIGLLAWLGLNALVVLGMLVEYRYHPQGRMG